MPAGLSTTAVLRSFREARGAVGSSVSLLVAGPMAEQLARDLAAGGDPGVVRTSGRPEDADGVVVVLAGAPAAEEVALARRAARANVAVVAVQLDPAYDSEVPYVLATDVVPCPPGEGFPVAGVATVLARRLGGRAYPLAAALPALREEISAEATRQAAALNALVALLPLSPAAHFPTMALNQLRLALGVSVANGRELGREGPLDAAAVLAAGLALRGLARSLVPHLPAGRRLARAAIAAGGTLALGEAAARRPSL
jgi:hypothetical protein